MTWTLRLFDSTGHRSHTDCLQGIERRGLGAADDGYNTHLNADTILGSGQIGHSARNILFRKLWSIGFGSENGHCQ